MGAMGQALSNRINASAEDVKDTVREEVMQVAVAVKNLGTALGVPEERVTSEAAGAASTEQDLTQLRGIHRAAAKKTDAELKALQAREGTKALRPPTSRCSPFGVNVMSDSRNGDFEGGALRPGSNSLSLIHI